MNNESHYPTLTQRQKQKEALRAHKEELARNRDKPTLALAAAAEKDLQSQIQQLTGAEKDLQSQLQQLTNQVKTLTELVVAPAKGK
jgi:predicted  nucleic acid-binding Zn-ribbon protein